MLSQHDRRALAAIEERLSAEAPDLARRLTRFDQWAPDRRRFRHRAACWVVALGVVLLVVAFVLRSADVLLLAAMVLMFGALRWTVIAARALARRRSARAPTER